MIDRACSYALVATVALVALAYAVRLARFGRARSARVASAGGTVFLGLETMEMAYWSLGPVVRALVRVRVSAAAVTWTSLLLGLAAGVALAGEHFGVGAVLACASALGDALDGLVARETGTASDAGEVLDASVDRYVEGAFLGGVAIAERAHPWLLALTLAAMVGSFMFSYATAKAEALGVDPPRGSMRRPERAVCLVLGAALTPMFDSRVVPHVPLVAALVLVATVANASAVRRLTKIAHDVRASKERA